jgi:hypothetical protein
MALKDQIPHEFYKAEYRKPVAKNVEQLIAQLQKLPPKLKIVDGFGSGCQLVVYNVNQPSGPILEISELD